MPRPLQLFSPSTWLRLPRRTAQLRLTALYGGLFSVSGAALLAVTYALFDRAARRASPPLRHPAGQLQKLLAAAAAQLASDRHQLVVSAGVALAIVAALAILAGWVVAGRVLRPVRTITAAARQISATNLHERLNLVGAGDEFKQLADTLDDLFARLATSFDARRHFVANASHELRTPLTADRTLIQVGLANPSTSAERWRAIARELLASSLEQERLIEALLTLASSEGGLDVCEPVDLSVVADGILVDIDRLDVHVEITLRPALLEGDPLLIERMVNNLVDNALRHNVPGGQAQIATDTKEGCAVLTVANTGPIIPPGEVDRLFQPLQRLDTRRLHYTSGHGLGLSIVGAIAAAHHADLAIRSHPGGGLDVEVRFPALAGRAPSSRTRPPEPPATPGSRPRSCREPCGLVAEHRIFEVGCLSREAAPRKRDARSFARLVEV